MLIKINIANKHPQVDGTPVIVCGNNDYQIQFAFDEEWDHSQMKTARFAWRKGGQARYIDVPFVGDTVDVPMLTEVHFVYVGVYTDSLRTTTPARIACEYSIRCNSGEDIQEPTPEDVLIDLFNLVTAQQDAAIKSADICVKAAAEATEAADTSVQTAETLRGHLANMESIEEHLGNRNNPHEVTADQLGVPQMIGEEVKKYRSENFTQGVALSWKVGAGGQNATALHFLPKIYLYNPVTGLVHFDFEMAFTGSFQAGEVVVVSHAGSLFLPPKSANRRHPITSESGDFSAYYERDMQGNTRINILANKDVTFDTGNPEILRGVNFSGWYFYGEDTAVG